MRDNILTYFPAVWCHLFLLLKLVTVGCLLRPVAGISGKVAAIQKRDEGDYLFISWKTHNPL